jgi:hypothetical protein
VWYVIRVGCEGIRCYVRASEAEPDVEVQVRQDKKVAGKVYSTARLHLVSSGYVCSDKWICC